MDSKWTSRKWKLAISLCILFTAIFVVPWVTTLVLTLCGSPVTFQLLSPELYVTLMTMLFSTYFGANAAVHWAAKGAKPTIEPGPGDEGQGNGAQPPEY